MLDAWNILKRRTKGETFALQGLLAGRKFFLYDASEFKGEGYVRLCRHKRTFIIFENDCISTVQTSKE